MKKNFTLIEIITVMVIIIILISLTLGVSNSIIKHKKINQVKSELVIIGSFIENFYDNRGYYPKDVGRNNPRNNNDYDLKKLGNIGTQFFQNLDANNSKKALSFITGKDPYGNTYCYRSSARSKRDTWITNKKSFDIWSMGEDGICQHSDAQANDDGDDIGNWNQ